MKNELSLRSTYRWDVCSVAVLITLLSNSSPVIGKLWQRYFNKDNLDLSWCIDQLHCDSINYLGSKAVKIAHNALNDVIVNSDTLKEMLKAYKQEL